MGMFSFLFGEDKSKRKNKKDTSQEIASTKTEEAQQLSSDAISPEIVAVIAAAAYVMFTAENPGISFKINRISNAWAATGRQKLMDARSFPQS